MSIEFRPARQDEIGQLGLIGAYVYAGAFGDGEDNFQSQSTRPEWTLCAFDGPKMVASYATIPFTMRANGRAMALGGVSSVGTIPEYRRRGLVRELTTRSLVEMRDSGQSVAALWASQAAIYQRYGYAAASSRIRYSIDSVDVRLLVEPDDGLTVERIPLAESFDSLRGVYRQFVAERMGYLHRSKVLWRSSVLQVDEQTGPLHTALCKNRAGESLGYVVFTLRAGKVENVARRQEIIVRDLAWLTIDACRALWSFLGRHDLVGRIVWEGAPFDDPTPELLAEPRLLHATPSEGFWMRVVDVEAALAARGYSAEGSIVLGVPSDGLAPWNEGSYRLEVEGGESRVTRTSDAPEIVVPVKALASAFSGFRRMTTLRNWGMVEGDREAIERADRLFATRFAPHCPDFF